MQRLQALAETTKDDLGLGPGCRPLGRVTQTKPLITKDTKAQ
jgi:hypothetical protein